MFEKAMLKKPFEDLFRKAVNDVKKNRYTDKIEELAELEAIMSKLLSDIIRERFDKLFEKMDSMKNKHYKDFEFPEKKK